MDKAPGVLIANQRVQRLEPAPRLRLLIELEPRHRLFFRNLADLLARWQPEQHPDVLTLIDRLARALSTDLPSPQAT